MKLLLTLILLATACGCFSQIPPPKKNTYVNDFAGVLNNDQITSLNKKIFYLEKEQNIQLAIVLINKIPTAYDIQDFAVLIGKKWHVGKNKRGIVYVASVEQHKQRIEVARNLDSIFSSKTCLNIMDKMKDPFRHENYAGGLTILVDDINSTLQNVSNKPISDNLATSPSTSTLGDQKIVSKKGDTFDTWVGFAFVAFVMICIVAYIRYRKRKNAEMIRNFEQMNNGMISYNPGQGVPSYNDDSQGYPQESNRGYFNGGRRSSRSRWGGILGGAAVGAAAGYGARMLQDKLNHKSLNHSQDDNSDTSLDNEPRNWGNWGGGVDDSSYDSGFSDDSSSDDSSSSGATSDW